MTEQPLEQEQPDCAGAEDEEDLADVETEDGGVEA